MNARKIVLSVAVLAPVCCPSLSAQQRTSIPTEKSCLAFVEEFYNWYLPKVRDMNVDSSDLALKERRSASVQGFGRSFPEGKFQKDIMPQLLFESGRWLFVNFGYPKAMDLLSQTRVYLDSVSKPPKKPQ